MAQMTARAFVQKDVIGQTLRKTMKDLAGGPLIRGSISVLAGHDYWWFIEFGTAGFHESNDGALTPPRSTLRHTPVGGGDYVIKAKARNKRGNLVYMLKSGIRRRRKAQVFHPGVKALGFVRTSVYQARTELKKELQRQLRLRKLRTRRNSLLTRDDLVELVNEVLVDLHHRLERRTPEDADIDPNHDLPRHPIPLRDAWTVTLAT